MKTVIIVQARMTSTRLPGKVLKEVLHKPLLEYQIERLLRVKSAAQVVIATTTNETDDPIISLCDRLNLASFRGSEDDVLSRYYDAANTFQADNVVRVTSDCPLIDPDVVESVIGHYLQNYPDYDYVSNTLTRTFPRGMDCEVFSFASLKSAQFNALQQAEREHVTPHIYRSGNYKLANVSNTTDISQYRWTVDTEADYQLIKLMLENLYVTDQYFSMADCLELLQRHPEWVDINAHVEQKQA